MELREYVGAIRKHWLLILVLMLVGGAAGGGYVLATPAQYSSTVQFFAATPSGTGTALQGDLFGQQRVNSYLKLLNTERLARRIVADTKLDLTPAQMAGKISGTTDLDTVLLTATVIDSSQERSFRIATSLSTQFVLLVNDLETRSGRQSAPVYLDVVSGPTLNTTPVSPRPNFDIGLGLAGGLLVGILLAILRKLMDTTLRSVDSLRSIGLPVLGTVAYDRAARRSPLVTDEQSQSVRSEALRQLRTNLRFVDVTSPAKVIVITSSIPGEGKSTTATNLALTFAGGGEKVLLIEADLRRPKVADYLGLEGTVGLTDVLIGSADVEDVLQPWGKGLTVLASGATAPNPSEILGSESMVKLLVELRMQFDTILIDTPPLLPVTDAAVLAVQADGALLVVRHGKTRRNQVAEAIQMLRGVDARVLGTVLNMAPVRGPDRHITYGYHADYSTIPRKPAEDATPAKGSDTEVDQPSRPAGSPDDYIKSPPDTRALTPARRSVEVRPSQGDNHLEHAARRRPRPRPVR